jgi:hypothetical protein
VAKIIQNGTAETASIAAILAASSSGYALDIFTAEEVAALKIVQKSGKPYLTCRATGKERAAKPADDRILHRPDQKPKHPEGLRAGGGGIRRLVRGAWDYYAWGCTARPCRGLCRGPAAGNRGALG